MTDVMQLDNSASVAQGDAQSRTQKPVALTPVRLLQAAKTVRGVFFPDWKPDHRWTLTLSGENPWVFCCDRRNGVIHFTPSRFTDRDELRAAIVLQLGLAWDFGTPGDALVEKLEDAQQVATSIRRPRLSRYLDDICRLAHSGGLDMLYDRVDDVVRTYNWLDGPDHSSVPVDHVDPMLSLIHI